MLQLQTMDSIRSIFVMVFIPLFLLCHSSLVPRKHKGNETDRVALLKFKSQIYDDPDQILSSWNDTVDFCRWQGITCGRLHPRVTKLELPNSRLGGSWSPYIGNLSFLRLIDMDNNSFTGQLPPEIGNLRRLRSLFLDNNSFSGQLPENISSCRHLREIALENSLLDGEIPGGLAALSELRGFQIYNNNFTGKFPDFLGNFSSLGFISAAYNRFWGTIPDSLGQLQKLRWLNLGANFFTGTIPTSIFNITSLAFMELGVNQLEGGLPRNIGITLLNLVYFSVADNHLTGLFPPSIANATRLQMFQLPINNLSGSVPDLKNLNQLQVFSISSNHLGSGESGDLSFVESINSTNLRYLAFDKNNFGGALPHSIGNISANLTELYFHVNYLTGTIPSSIGNLCNLEELIMHTNQLTGRLPDEISNLYKLKRLTAQDNAFYSEIPSSFGNLTMLTILTLAGNKLQGNIPASLGNCKKLILLDLSRNSLSGVIPYEVFSISSLTILLDLSHNKLTGALPDEIGDLTNLASLYLQENRLSGQVPNALGRCSSLEELDIGGNMFLGNISSFLSPLKGLQYIDLSRNIFSGEIPKFLEVFQLTYLNLSFNEFEGEVPNQGVFLNATGISVQGNAKLCGGISSLNLPSCPNLKSMRRRKSSSKVIIVTASGISLSFLLLSFLALYVYMRTYKKRTVRQRSGLVSIGQFPQVSYEDILKATGGLDQNNLIGAGSFGCVYKGILGNGDNNMVGIKVFDLRTRAASKTFMAECEALRNIRHRNLVKIVTACSTVDFQGVEFKALVYEYMQNGSLEDWLHPRVKYEGVHQRLSLLHRLRICIDIACAVEYLHHECETPIIHCDLKPSNVLLDVEMTAHVGDFGLAKILSAAEVVLQVSSSGVRGTIGYSPPEYGMGSHVSREGDVYSYGILLLEMFTGKRPTDGMFEDAWNIRSYCEAALPEGATEIADPCMFSNESGEGSIIRAPMRVKECLLEVFEVGISCCRESPSERMDIRVAAARLRSIKV